MQAIHFPQRLFLIAAEQMTPARRAAADDLIAGPRTGVKGPFIALLRSHELLARLQKVGEFLRVDSSLPARASEFATMIVARAFDQQFEWFMQLVSLALNVAGIPKEPNPTVRPLVWLEPL